LQAQLAGRLLAQDVPLFLIQQEPNHYCFPDDPAAPEVALLWRCYHCYTFAPHFTQPACHCADHAPPLFEDTTQPRHRIRYAASNYDFEILTWKNVNDVLPPPCFQKYTVGVPWWLETPEITYGLDGRPRPKRYPVIIGLAYRLIKKWGEGNVVRVLEMDLKSVTMRRREARSLRRTRLRESVTALHRQHIRAAAAKVAENPPDLSGLWVCPNCGQTYYNFDGGDLPDTCAFCDDFTTWGRLEN